MATKVLVACRKGLAMMEVCADLSTSEVGEAIQGRQTLASALLELEVRRRKGSQ